MASNNNNNNANRGGSLKSSAGSLVCAFPRGAKEYEKKYEKISTIRNHDKEVIDLVKRKGGTEQYCAKYIQTEATVSGGESLILLRRIRNEIEKAQKLDHPNIVSVSFERCVYAVSGARK